jgi:hypothetical protein
MTPTTTQTPTNTTTQTPTNTVTPTTTPTPTSTTLPNLNCSGTTDAGLNVVKDSYITLNPSGGVITMLFYVGSAPDKLEIYHGLPLSGGTNKVATSSMIANNNYGPFDNVWGTNPNPIPATGTTANRTDQFIGTSWTGGTSIPQRRIQYSADTGVNIPTMSYPNPRYPGSTYQQVIWWKYTSADYSANPIVTIRVTGGGGGTGWSFYRLCI